MSGRGGTVYELLISDQAFAIIAAAIHALNLQTQRFNTLRDVVGAALREPTFTDRELLEEFKSFLPIDGPVRIYFRANTDEREDLEKGKETLCALLKGICNSRETIVFCAYLLIKKYG